MKKLSGYRYLHNQIKILLFIIIGAFVLLNVLINTFVFFYNIRQITEIQSERINNARFVIEQYLDELYGALIIVTKNAGFDGLNNQSKLSLMNILLKSNSAFKSVYIIDSDGRIDISCCKTGVFQQVETSVIDFGMLVIRNQEKRFTADSENANLIIGAPLRDNRNSINKSMVIIADISYLYNVNSSIKTGGSGYTYLIDEDNRLVMIKSGRITDELKADFDVMINSNGGDFVGSDKFFVKGLYSSIVHRNIVSIKFIGWRLISEIPIGEAFILLRIIGWITLALIITVIAVVLVFTFIVKNNITKPVDSLIEFAEETGKGHFDYRIKPRYSNEFQKISDAFNRMGDRISRYILEIKSSEERFHYIFDYAVTPMFEVDISLLAGKFTSLDNSNQLEISQIIDGSRIININQSCYKLFETDKTEELFTLLRTTINENPVLASDVFKSLINGKEVKPFELQIKTSNNINKTVMLNLFVSGNFYQKTIIFGLHDITYLKERESVLSKENELLDITIKNINEGIITIDARGIIILANDAAAMMIGIPLGELKGSQISNSLRLTRADHPDIDIDVKSIAIGFSGSRYDNNNVALVLKSGKKIFINISISRIPDNFRTNYESVIVIRDISERLNYERELIKIEKLESIGLLAGGIAHEFNNLLTGVLSNAGLIKISAEPGSDIHLYINAIEDAAQKSRILTNKLLTFSTGGVPVCKPVDLKSLIEVVVVDIRNKSDCIIVTDIADNLIKVSGDKDQLYSVFYNVIINGVQAMPQGGKIKVTGINSILNEGNEYLLSAGNYCYVSISDEGEGVSKDITNHIFDPFFSTRRSGTGMGLPTALSIVRRHNGYIGFRLNREGGTTFFVYLPSVE